MAARVRSYSARSTGSRRALMMFRSGIGEGALAA
jgi:hypothetical protein